MLQKKNLQASWEKGLDRVAHIEKLLGLLYVILFGLAYHIFGNIKSTGIEAKLFYVALIMCIGVASIHLGNLIVTIGVAIIKTEQREEDLCIFEMILQNCHSFFKYSLLIILYAPAIISNFMVFYILKENPKFALISVVLFSVLTFLLIYGTVKKNYKFFEYKPKMKMM